MGTTEKPLKVFIAFADSEQDRKLKDQLQFHLSYLEKQQIIEAWDMGEIVAGSEREQEIKRNLAQSTIILLLMSADFFNSPICDEIRKIALKRYEDKEDQTFVVPVMLRKVYWQMSALAKFKILPSEKYALNDRHWQNIDEALTLVVDEVMQIVTLIRNQTSESHAQHDGDQVEIVNPKLNDYKEVVEVKNIKSSFRNSENGSLLQNRVSEDSHEKQDLIDRYLSTAATADRIKIADVELSKAELHLKKAVLLYNEGVMAQSEAEQKQKYDKAYHLLIQARRLEPRNIDVLLELAQLLIVLTPDDISDEEQVLRQIEAVIKQPTNEHESFVLAQAQYLYATLNVDRINLNLLAIARDTFQRMGQQSWVDDCNEMLRQGQAHHPTNQVTPPPVPFNPIGNWRVEVHSLIPTEMQMQLFPNGALSGTQFFIPFQGVWSFLNGYFNFQANFFGNPVALGIQLQYERDGAHHGIGSDGNNYVFHRQ